MDKEYHYAQYSKQILNMPLKEAVKTLNYVLKCDGETELNRIISQFSKVLGGVRWKKFIKSFRQFKMN